MKNPKKISLMTIITGRRKKDRVLTLLTDNRCPIITTSYGQGTVSQNYLEMLLGLTPEEEKTVINCIIRNDQKEKIYQLLISECHFDQPNTGIAFSSPVDNIVF
ncbi:hypothetical protein [Enterococcus sp. LJL120]